ncbi:MAG: hypothetical protein NVSMB64_19130 [Candidatus Velthaea sp.]
MTNTEMNVPPVSASGASGDKARAPFPLQRTLVWAGIAAASAALTFFLVRSSMRRAPLDETSERIQSLIDEANRLLRTLDEKKNG